jgi:hypothetical protein
VSNLNQLKTDLLAWAGYHRGKAIQEEAMPRFHEIMDQFDIAEHEHQYQVVASQDAVVRHCSGCTKSQVLRKNPVSAMWVDIP